MSAAVSGSWLDVAGLVVGALGAVGGLAGLGSAWIAWHEWKKVNRKVAMLTDAGAAFEVVPAWYTRRMMGDQWLFGLQTTDGKIIAINTITAISDDGEWMDIELAQEHEVEHLGKRYGDLIVAVAHDRTGASVRIRNIVAAYDLVTS